MAYCHQLKLNFLLKVALHISLHSFTLVFPVNSVVICTSVVQMMKKLRPIIETCHNIVVNIENTIVIRKQNIHIVHSVMWYTHCKQSLHNTFCLGRSTFIQSHSTWTNFSFSCMKVKSLVQKPLMTKKKPCVYLATCIATANCDKMQLEEQILEHLVMLYRQCICSSFAI